MPDYFWYLIAWVPYTAILFYYGFGSPWYRSAIGRSLFLSKLALFLLLTFVLSIFVFGQYPGLEIVRSVLLSCLALAATYQLIVFRREQLRKRTDPPAPARPTLPPR